MNGMVYIRGDRLDYDGWAYHGCPGLVLRGRAAAVQALRGLRPRRERGPRRRRPAARHDALRAASAARRDAGGVPGGGHPVQRRPQRRRRDDGVGPAQLTIRDGRRHTAAVAFVHPILDHPNLTVLTDARALGLRFDGARCTGVEIARDGTTEVLEATAEVVLSAGSLESPRLLMLAGIGPADDSRVTASRHASTCRASAATCTTTTSRRSCTPRRSRCPPSGLGCSTTTSTSSGAADRACGSPTPSR